MNEKQMTLFISILINVGKNIACNIPYSSPYCHDSLPSHAIYLTLTSIVLDTISEIIVQALNEIVNVTDVVMGG